MSAGSGRYCGISDATALQSRAGRLLNSPSLTFLVIQISLGSDYSTCGCELKTQGSISLAFPSRLEPTRVYDNKCFEYDAEMTVRTARGPPLVVRMVLKEERILETGCREIFFLCAISYASQIA